MPVSIAITRGPSPSRISGSAGVTSRARSAPVIDGSAITRSRACLGHVGGEDPAAHRTLVADMADERARVDAGQRRDAAVGQPGEPAALGVRGVLAVDRPRA